jgi:hypothetical protein
MASQTGDFQGLLEGIFREILPLIGLEASSKKSQK